MPASSTATHADTMSSSQFRGRSPPIETTLGLTFPEPSPQPSEPEPDEEPEPLSSSASVSAASAAGGWVTGPFWQTEPSRRARLTAAMAPLPADPARPERPGQPGRTPRPPAPKGEHAPLGT